MSKKPNFFDKIKFRFDIFLEKLSGTDFLSVIDPKNLGLDEKLVTKGSGSGGYHLNKVLENLNITKKDRILDIGCSKGSAIKTMLNFPFNQIAGIEISKHLTDVAKKNFKLLKVNNVKIININAEKFKFYSNYNYFYMYNPFPNSVMNNVIKKIINQTPKNKTINLIYNNPVCSSIIKKNGFTKIKKYDDKWGNGIVLFRKSR